MIITIPARTRTSGMRLSVEEQIFIIWARYQHWTLRATARVLPAHRQTVKKYLESLGDNPKLILVLPLIHEWGRNQFQCLLCLAVRETVVRAVRHAVAHAVPDEVARYANLAGIKSPRDAPGMMGDDTLEIVVQRREQAPLGRIRRPARRLGWRWRWPWRWRQG